MSDVFKVGEGYLIFDTTLGRVFWVDSDFEHVRSQPLGRAPLRVALLPDQGGVVVNGLFGDIGRGHVPQVLGFDGSRGPPFGGDGRPLDLRRNRLGHRRVIAVDPDGGIWASRLNRYQLIRFSERGDTLAVIERTGALDDRDPPPTPRMRDLVFDRDGLLWTVFLVADPDWRDAVPNPDPLYAPDDNGVWDTVVEVLDPRSGQLLARTRVPWSLSDVEMTETSGHGLLWFITEKPTGALGATILRFTLETH